MKTKAANQAFDWNGIINGIESALAEASQQCQDRQNEAAKVETVGEPQIEFGHLQKRLGRLDDCLRRSEGVVKKADAFFEDEQAAVRQRLQAVQSLRHKLATWSSDTV